MILKNIQYNVSHSFITLVVSTVLAIVSWLFSCFDTTFKIQSLWIDDKFIAFINGSGYSWILFIAVAFWALLIVYLLLLLNGRFILIRHRTTFQVSLFLFFVAGCKNVHAYPSAFLSAFLILLAINFLLATYQNPNNVPSAFYCSVFVGAASIIVPQYLWLIPVFLCGQIIMQAFTPRIFIASVIGWLVPYWFLFAHAYFYDELPLFYAPFVIFARSLSTLQFSMEWWKIGTILFFLLLFVISFIHFMATELDDKVRTRSYLTFMLLLNFFLLLIAGLQWNIAPYVFPTLFAVSSFTFGHFLVLSKSLIANMLFLFLILLYVAFFILNFSPIL